MEGLQDNWALICLEDQLAFFDFVRADFDELDRFQDGWLDRGQGPPGGSRDCWQRSISVAVSGDLRVQVVLPVDGGAWLRLDASAQDVAVYLGAVARQGMGGEERFSAKGSFLRDGLPDAGVAALLAVAGEDEGTDVRLLDEDLASMSGVHEALEEF